MWASTMGAGSIGVWRHVAPVEPKNNASEIRIGDQHKPERLR